VTCGGLNRPRGKTTGEPRMKPTILKATVTAFLLSVSTALCAELFSAAELTDLRGNKSFVVLTDQEKLKTEADLAAEAKAFPNALEETKSEWLGQHPEQVFPGNRLKPCSLRVLATTIDREEANKLALQNKGRETRILANEKGEDSRVLNAKKRNGWRGNNPAGLEQQKREIRETRERESLADKIEALLRQKLAAAVGHEIPSYGEERNSAKKSDDPKK